jgi:hypothetical protein
LPPREVYLDSIPVPKRLGDIEVMGRMDMLMNAVTAAVVD